MKTFILLKARLKENLFTTTYLRDLYRKDRLWVLALAGIGIAVTAVFFILLFYRNYAVLYELGNQNGAPETVVLFAGVISGVLVFFTGTPLCLSNVFYSKDNVLAASLPVTNAEIVISRILLLYLFTLPIHLAVVVPALVVFLSQQFSAAAVTGSLIFSLSGTMLPLVLTFAASAILVKIGTLSGRRSAVEITGMTVAVVLLGAIQIAASRVMISEEGISDISNTLIQYADILKHIFFASSWTASGFRPEGAAFTLLGLVFRVFIAVCFALLLNLLKFRIVTTEGGGVRHKKHAGRATPANYVPPKVNSPVTALMKREWIVVRSNSAFIFEITGEVFVLPILLVVFYFSIPGDIMKDLHEFTAEISYLPGVVLAILILTNSINSVSSTSLSREGATFAISKYIPQSGSTQVKAKMYFHMALFTVSWYLNMIILILILKLPAIHLVYLVPAGPVVVLLGFITAIHIDLSRPVLRWTHPQQAMKQNMNVLIGLGFGLVICAGLILPGVGLNVAGLSPVASGLVTTAVAGTADFVLLPRIMRYSDRRYIEIIV